MNGTHSRWASVVERMDAVGAETRVFVLHTDDYPHRGESGATEAMALNWLRRQQKSLRMYLNDVQRDAGRTALVRIDGDALVAWWTCPPPPS